MKKPLLYLIFCLFLSSCFNFNYSSSSKKKSIKKEAILLLHIESPITRNVSKTFMKNIREYAKNPNIKGVLIRIDSPGGAVGSSEEINSAVREVRDLYKKPVFVSGGDLVASGAVYSIVSANKIFVNKGTIFGSIGVLVPVRDFSELMRWAKVDIFNLKAGEFKDILSPYRKMTLRERELLENHAENVLSQFKEAIIQGRKLDSKVVESVADGRFFSGEEAVELGLADAIGSFNHVVQAIGEKTGLGSDPNLFDPNAKSGYEKFFENLAVKFSKSQLFPFLDQLEKLSGRPLFMSPYGLPQ